MTYFIETNFKYDKVHLSLPSSSWIFISSLSKFLLFIFTSLFADEFLKLQSSSDLIKDGFLLPLSEYDEDIARH